MKLCLFVLIALTGIAMTIAMTSQEYNDTVTGVLYEYKGTFSEAKDACNETGTIMVYPNSKSEIAELYDFLNSLKGPASFDDKQIWVAAPNYPDSDNNCMMLNGEEIVPVKCSEQLYAICFQYDNNNTVTNNN